MEDKVPRIFLIEDDPVISEMVREAISEEGWAFDCLSLTAEAVPALTAFSPDLVLLDVNLPDGDGFSVCRALRAAEGPLREVPVIFLTSKGEVSNRLQGFSSGGQDYLTKPFAIEELLARMRAHLAMKAKRDELWREVLDKATAERVRQDVVDMIVHDLKSPLATIEITLDLIQKSELVKDESLRKFLGYADSSTEFALLMVNDLLDLSAGRLKVQEGPVVLAALFQKAETFFTLQFRKKGMSLVFEPSGGPEVVSDPVLLFRVLSNLIGNALKFSTAEGQVTVSGRIVAGLLRLEIADEGYGIADEQKALIFDKYYRADALGAATVPGTGIGLSFCRMAAQALKGRVWVEDNKPKGSRFIIEVPPLDRSL